MHSQSLTSAFGGWRHSRRRHGQRCLALLGNISRARSRCADIRVEKDVKISWCRLYPRFAGASCFRRSPTATAERPEQSLGADVCDTPVCIGRGCVPGVVKAQPHAGAGGGSCCWKSTPRGASGGGENEGCGGGSGVGKQLLCGPMSTSSCSCHAPRKASKSSWVELTCCRSCLNSSRNASWVANNVCICCRMSMFASSNLAAKAPRAASSPKRSASRLSC
mmetsp:Transcript_31478/g.92099  ORF Transcript_31478/g.92099 Transcript_31478/m.92099 type:complete len:221 (-) Transcript_31478:760-1422(-)